MNQGHARRPNERRSQMARWSGRGSRPGGRGPQPRVLPAMYLRTGRGV